MREQNSSSSSSLIPVAAQIGYNRLNGVQSQNGILKQLKEDINEIHLQIKIGAQFLYGIKTDQEKATAILYYKNHLRVIQKIKICQQYKHLSKIIKINNIIENILDEQFTIFMEKGILVILCQQNIIKYLFDVYVGIKQLLKEGIIHMDLHPRNIYQVEGQFKILDFDQCLYLPIKNKIQFLQMLKIALQMLGNPQIRKIWHDINQQNQSLTSNMENLSEELKKEGIMSFQIEFFRDLLFEIFYSKVIFQFRIRVQKKDFKHKNLQFDCQSDYQSFWNLLGQEKWQIQDESLSHQGGNILQIHQNNSQCPELQSIIINNNQIRNFILTQSFCQPGSQIKPKIIPKAQEGLIFFKQSNQQNISQEDSKDGAVGLVKVDFCSQHSKQYFYHCYKSHTFEQVCGDCIRNIKQNPVYCNRHKLELKYKLCFSKKRLNLQDDYNQIQISNYQKFKGSRIKLIKKKWVRKQMKSHRQMYFCKKCLRKRIPNRQPKKSSQNKNKFLRQVLKNICKHNNSASFYCLHPQCNQPKIAICKNCIQENHKNHQQYCIIPPRINKDNSNKQPQIKDEKIQDQHQNEAILKEKIQDNINLIIQSSDLQGLKKIQYNHKQKCRNLDLVIKNMMDISEKSTQQNQKQNKFFNLKLKEEKKSQQIWKLVSKRQFAQKYSAAQFLNISEYLLDKVKQRYNNFYQQLGIALSNLRENLNYLLFDKDINERSQQYLNEKYKELIYKNDSTHFIEDQFLENQLKRVKNLQIIKQTQEKGKRIIKKKRAEYFHEQIIESKKKEKIIQIINKQIDEGTARQQEFLTRPRQINGSLLDKTREQKAQEKNSIERQLIQREKNTCNDYFNGENFTPRIDENFRNFKLQMFQNLREVRIHQDEQCSYQYQGNQSVRQVTQLLPKGINLNIIQVQAKDPLKIQLANLINKFSEQSLNSRKIFSFSSHSSQVQFQDSDTSEKMRNISYHCDIGAFARQIKRDVFQEVRCIQYNLRSINFSKIQFNQRTNRLLKTFLLKNQFIKEFVLDKCTQVQEISLSFISPSVKIITLRSFENQHLFQQEFRGQFLEKLTDLRSLNLHRIKTAQSFRIYPQNQNLRVLRLNYLKLNQQFFKSLAPLQQLPVHLLNLSNSHFKPEDLLNLKMQEIHHLDISYCKGFDDNLLKRIGRNCKTITHLNIIDCEAVSGRSINTQTYPLLLRCQIEIENLSKQQINQFHRQGVQISCKSVTVFYPLKKPEPTKPYETLVKKAVIYYLVQNDLKEPADLKQKNFQEFDSLEEDIIKKFIQWLNHYPNLKKLVVKPFKMNNEKIPFLTFQKVTQLTRVDCDNNYNHFLLPHSVQLIKNIRQLEELPYVIN